MKPRLGIELDDASHERRDRQERDEFVEAVFKAAGLPLLRMPARRAYNLNEVRSMIEPCLDPRSPPSRCRPLSPALVRQSARSAACRWWLRTASKGSQAGQQFFGCQELSEVQRDYWQITTC